jgi:hypothetical protein
MAARTRKITQTEGTRAKIQAAYYIRALHNHVTGAKSMSDSQIKAAKILLDKSLPSLSDVKLDTGTGGITFNLNANLPKSE